MNRREFIQLAGTGAMTVLLSGCGLGALTGEKSSKEAKEFVPGSVSGGKNMKIVVITSSPHPQNETLVCYMEWQDVGQVWATGCGARSLVEKSSFADMAYKIGANL